MHSLLRSLSLVLVMLICAPSSGAADDGIILRIEGQVAPGRPTQFTRAELERMGVATIRTGTPWHDGQQVFEGVPLEKLMEAVGAHGDTIEVIALNRYRSMVPMRDFSAHKPILAMKRNGAYMTVRDKGPLFIIYPYDSDPALKTEQFYTRSVWQIATIVVK